MAEQMPRLSSSTLKHRLWRFAMMATPLPVLARPLDSAFWQKHWARDISDQELPGYARSTELKKWLARQLVDLGADVGARVRKQCRRKFA
jgi:hypothetical protein